MTEPPSHPNHLEPSKLGTKEYWDALYATELSNNANNPSDTGTVWFDDSDAEAKLVEFLEGRAEKDAGVGEGEGRGLGLGLGGASFLDVGCGNGSLLFALRGAGWRGRMVGVDYSGESVALARRVGRLRGGEGGEGGRDMLEGEDDGEDDGGKEEEEGRDIPEVEFEEWDVLNGPYDVVLSGEQKEGWDVVLDKGTFDAICLSEERDERGRRICEGYKGRVMRLVRKGGLFIVTSCNWTEEELRAWFVDEGEAETGTGEGAKFVQDGRVEYKAFSFGGVKGQTISTLCFRKE